MLMLALAILDPRKWRLRLKQLGGTFAALGWIWFRAVNRSEVVRAVADARHADRAACIRERNLELEAERLAS